MLQTLRIKNFALVSDLALEFEPGFSAITGETGAGKSILIGALNLLLGQRAERNLIRSGTDHCVVEALFAVGPLRDRIDSMLTEQGLDSGGPELFLKRSVSSNGSNRQFVNGSPCSLQTLGRLGDLLVDIHGPHEHQSLLQSGKQLDLLDAFAGLAPDLKAFAALLSSRRILAEGKDRLLTLDEKSYWQQVDLLRHQCHEIESARLQPEEEERLEADYQRASQASGILQRGRAALDLLSGDEPGLQAQSAGLGRLLQELRALDPGLEEISATHVQIASLIQELQRALEQYLDRIDLDPDRLRALEERLDLVQSLKRKYGRSIPEVLAFAGSARERLQALESRDEELRGLNSRLAAAEAELWKAGAALSARRKKAIPRLVKAVNHELAELGFKEGAFDVALQSPGPDGRRVEALAGSGLDRAEFMFAPNTGEALRPLKQVASSGEIARVMLALKTVLAKQDDVPVLIFDEVDANVAGETGRTIAGKMAALAAHRQVLCITHLAPIAASADWHFHVDKEVKEGRTHSTVARLDRESRTRELARMLGGQSSAALKHAEALLEKPRGNMGL